MLLTSFTEILYAVLFHGRVEKCTLKVLRNYRKYGTLARGAIMVEFSGVSVKYFTVRSPDSSNAKTDATFPHR